jgi:hypothetical protein
MFSLGLIMLGLAGLSSVESFWCAVRPSWLPLPESAP